MDSFLDGEFACYVFVQLVYYILMKSVCACMQLYYHDYMSSN